MAASVGLCFSRTALVSILTTGAYLAAWALLCVPISEPLKVIGWYGFCEALSSLVGAWILYTTLRWKSRGSGIPISGERAARVARALFGITCVFYGWSHFVYADYTATMVPSWLPGRLEMAYFTGLGHIAAGIGLVVVILPRLAATLEAIMVSLFSILVWSGCRAFMQPAADSGHAASQSMVGVRGDTRVDGRRVACRDFIARPLLGFRRTSARVNWRRA